MFICRLRCWPWREKQLPHIAAIFSCVLVMMMSAGCLSSLLHQHTRVSLLSQQMMGHLCLTGATGVVGPFLTCLLIIPFGEGEEPIRRALGSMLSQICGCCRPPADLTEKNLGKHSRSSPVAQRRTSGLEEVKEVLSFLWGQRGACDFMSAGGVSEVLMQMRSF